MRRSGRHVGEHPGAGHEAIIANRESDLAFKDVKAFFFPAVDVWERPAAWRNDGFPQGVLAVRVLAGRQEAVHVANNGNGAAFTGFFDKKSCWTAHRSVPPLLRRQLHHKLYCSLNPGAQLVIMLDALRLDQ